MQRARPLRHARSTTPPLGYQPSLDGLRAIAAGAVLLYHGGVDWAGAGFLGVDVFFVLSGFLITWLLIDEHARDGGISVRGFYGRRLRRLLPALVLVVAAVAVYAVTVAPRAQLASLRADLLATVTYASNWRFVADGREYFDQFAAPSPLAHTWSLSVEEQWYLLWPLTLAGLLALARRWRRPDLAAAATAVLVVAAVAWTLALDLGGAGASRLHYGTDVRTQQLLGGALLAMALHRRGGVVLSGRARRVADAVGVAALVWLLWTVAALDDSTGWLHSSGLLAVTIATAAVVLAAVQPEGVVRRALSSEPLRLAGLVSYGLYLWHYPTYVVLSSSRTGLDGTALLAVRLLATVALAVVSYRLVERPVRDRRWSLRPTLATGGVALAASVAVVAVLAGSVTPVALDPALAAIGAPPPTQPTVPEPVDPATIAALTPTELAAIEQREAALVDAMSALDPDPFEYSPEVNPAPELAPDDTRLRLFATGDSVNLTLIQGFPINAANSVLLWARIEIGCSIMEGERSFEGGVTDGGNQCPAWRADRPNWVHQFDADVVMLGASVWETYDRQVDGEWLQFGSPEADDFFSDHLDVAIDELSATGATVAILTAPCNRRPEPITGQTPPENDDARIDHLNELYRAAADRHSEAEIVDLHGFACPNGEYVAEFGGQPQRTDGVHFTLAGAGRVWRWLLPQLRTVAAADP